MTSYLIHSLIMILWFIDYKSWAWCLKILLTLNFLWRWILWRCSPLKNIKSVTEMKSKNGITQRIEKIWNFVFEFYSEIVNISLIFLSWLFSCIKTDNDVIVCFQFTASLTLIGKFLGHFWGRFTGKLIQSSIGEFWGVTQTVLLENSSSRILVWINSKK